MKTPVQRVAVLFALRRESMFFVRLLSKARRLRHAPCAAWIGSVGKVQVLVVEGGMGAEKTRKALEWLDLLPIIDSSIFSADILINSGFCGALTTRHTVGEVVQASAIVNARGFIWTASHSIPNLDAVRLVTHSTLVGEPAQKEQLAREYDAHIVDMEAAEVALHCAARGLPLLCLRSISDDSATTLSPHLAELLSHGRVSAVKLIRLLLRRPWLIKEMLRLARHTRKAGIALAEALRESLSLLAQTNSSS